MKHFLILSFCLFYLTSTAQSSLKDILWSKDTFDKIVTDGENYFSQKHPNRTLNQLTTGEFRDSEYVKFMRWQSYWKNSLEANGTLADVPKYVREATKENPTQQRTISPYKDVDWTNLTYVDYITSQIGLGRTTSIGFHPTNANIFYVGAAIGGIWRTTDGGQSYTPLGDDLPWMAVSSIVVKKSTPNILYIAVSDHVGYGPPGIGVFISTDSGVNWVPSSLNFNLSDNVRIYWIEPDPNNPNKMFVATSDGLYRTTNSFDSVSKVSTVSCFDVKFKPGDSNIVYLGGNNGEFLRSTNGGNSFSPVTDFGGGNVYVAVTSLNTSKVYARNASTLHKSTDSGVSFPNTSPMPVPNSVLTFAPSDENILLAGNFETDRSDNDGGSFYKTSQWLGDDGLPLIHVDQRNIFTNPLESDYVYYCNDGGVYRYIISTNSFDNLCNGLQITQFYDIAVSQTDENVIGGGSQDNGNVFRESNGVWDDYAPTGDGMNQEIDPTDANVRYWAYQNGDIHRWVNGTNTYIAPPGQTNGAGAWETPFKLDPNNSDRLVIGYDKVYSSIDRGDNWDDISGTANFGGDLNEIAIAKSNSNRIYASRANQLFVKNTADNNWTTRTMPGTAADLEVDPLDMNHIYIVTPGYVNGQKVYESTDAGANWTNISGNLANISVDALELYETIDGAIFIGTDIGVFYKDGNHPDWQVYGDLPNTRVDDIEIQYAEKLIRVGTHGRGVLEASIIIDVCNPGDPDADNDGICDANDACPNFNDSLIGTACDDGDPNTTGEVYQTDCSCGGGSDTGIYCAAEGLDGTGGDYIILVSLHDMYHESSFSDYSDFRNISTTLSMGSSYTLKMQLSESFDLDEVYAWIDYDRNLSFDSDELIVMSDFNGANESTGTVNVPIDVGFGATTMRVRSRYSDPNTPDPCGDYFGEVEDYTIHFDYCDATGLPASTADWINNVNINTINHDSQKSLYSDFKDISTDLDRGQSYPIEVKMNYAFAINDVYVWVDFNQNKIFEESERIVMSGMGVGSNQVATGTVNVPNDAQSGKTIIRVRSQFDDPDNPIACGGAYGEVEDYTVNISYCAAIGAGGTGDDYIQRVTLNTINNTSGKTSYSDFTSISTDLIRGASYPIEVELRAAFEPDSVYVWIDYNKDGVFESTEQIYMSDPPDGVFNALTQGMVTVPANAIQGETTMRVRSIFADPNSPDPCGSYFGEVEDYTVNLTYCAGSGNLGNDHITNVMLNDIDHSTGSDGYSNYSGSQQTPLYIGQDNVLTVTMNNTVSGDLVHVWIDYDDNASFTFDELTVLPFDTGSTYSGPLSTPADVTVGLETTMRIRFNYGADPDPCGIYSGEVEDYGVTIEYPDLCDNKLQASCGQTIINNTADIYNFDDGCGDFGDAFGLRLYEFTPFVSGDVDISLTGFTADKDLIIFTNSCEGSCVLVALSDAFDATDELITLNAVAGTTYDIVVYDYAGDGGQFFLSIDCPDPCEEDITLVSPNDDIPGGVAFAATNKSIYASNKITGVSSVDYSAGSANGEEISLEEGFEVGLGAFFHAYMDGCLVPSAREEKNK